MSPRVQLILHPDGDAAFASHAQISLEIDLPETYQADEVVAAIQAELRRKYPLAELRVEVAETRDGDVWHVYRDGVPTNASRRD